MTTNAGLRTTEQRTRDTPAGLASERDVWVSTSHPGRGPHQVPLWFNWHEGAVWMCTGARSATVRNLQEGPRVRLALADTTDVVTVQGSARSFPAQEVPSGAADAYTAKFGWDPRSEDGPFTYLCVTPETVRAWRSEAELKGRVIMRDGTWLA